MMVHCQECDEHRKDHCYLCDTPLCIMCGVVVGLEHPDNGTIDVDCCYECGKSINEYQCLWMPLAIELRVPFPKA